MSNSETTNFLGVSANFVMTERTVVPDLLQTVQAVGDEAAPQSASEQEADQGRDVLDRGGGHPGPSGDWVKAPGTHQAHRDPTYLGGLQGRSLETLARPHLTSRLVKPN